jgi:multidrug efflux pump subunit AcrA (membrane-fusion protein)
MSARARLRIPAQRSGLVIPRDALLRYPDGRVVVWKLSDGDSGAVVYELAVRTGQVFGDRVEIVEGLGPGDEIVVRGNESLRNGQRVHIRGRGEP